MLSYTSKLQSQYLAELEDLMFFNPGQQLALDSILESIDSFGPPTVSVENHLLRVKVEKLDEVQTLFAIDDCALAGVLVYSRISLDCLTIIHLAVNENYTSNGKFAEKMLVMRLLNLLRKNARRIKSIKAVRLMCNGREFKDYPV